MKFDKLKYLERIGLTRYNVSHCDLPTLKKLHYNHLLNIPFENIDIHYGRKIILDTEKLFDKIVNGRRGGFCYELNGLFCELLKSLGYHVKMISAMVYNNKEKTLGPEFDHMALIVKINKKEYLCDVGFGCNTVEPLEFITNIIQLDREGNFIINKYDERSYVLRKIDGDKPTVLFLFTETERRLEEFTEMCNYHQTSPESNFTKKKLCSQLTVEGMKTVSDNKFIITNRGIKTEIHVKSEYEFLKLLKEHFDISI